MPHVLRWCLRHGCSGEQARARDRSVPQVGRSVCCCSPGASDATAERRATRIPFSPLHASTPHASTLLEALQFEDHFYTWEEVERMVRDLLSPASGERLVWRVGMCLGWLSALALTDRSVAECGVGLLCSLANAEYRGVR